MTSRQFATPLLLSGSGRSDEARPLRRVQIGRSSGGDHRFDERWLQELIHHHPELLPIDEIEPALTPLVPVCLELPTPSGPIDNLFVTPGGGLVLAECKLWRNPEARRQVVAQAIDYARCLIHWTYEDLEGAIRRATLPNGSNPSQTLWDLFRTNPDLEERDFIDAVSRNLRLGRALVLIVGDGVREQMVSLADHLQVHAGLHFTLALAEISVHELPDESGLLVQPRVLARTVNIERGIVRLDGGRLVCEPPRLESGAGGATQRTTLTEELFFERLAEQDPSLPERLRGFLGRLESLGVAPEVKRSLILRWTARDETPFNLGYIMTNGDVWTDAVNWKAKDAGMLDLSHDYVTQLARAIDGEVNPGQRGDWYVVRNGKSPKIDDLLRRQDAWIAAVESFTSRANDRLLQAGTS
jgi:hypothetical protein